MSVYRQLSAAGVTLAHHESDLYAAVAPASRAILDGYAFRSNVTTFRSDDPADNGALFYEIPFAYDPYWMPADPDTATALSEAAQAKAASNNA